MTTATESPGVYGMPLLRGVYRVSGPTAAGKSESVRDGKVSWMNVPAFIDGNTAPRPTEFEFAEYERIRQESHGAVAEGTPSPLAL
jgi:hypothetical protein